MQRARGTGTISNGYVMIERDGIAKFEHVRIAEKALGKLLPRGAEVHHIDGNKANNDPINLVVCPSHKYHSLLHQRRRALDVCGNADWRVCSYCKNYDDTNHMKEQGRGFIHVECKRNYDKRRNNKARFGVRAA